MMFTRNIRLTEIFSSSIIARKGKEQKMSVQLPPEYETPYEVAANNSDLEKGVYFYVHEMAVKNGYLLGVNAEKHLFVRSIIPFLRILGDHNYMTYFVRATKLPGLMSQVTFIIEERNGPTVLRTEVTFVSEDYDDYEKYIKGQILPQYKESGDLR